MQQLEIDQFARRLQTAMSEKGMSNSDLARAIWGETEQKTWIKKPKTGGGWRRVPGPSYTVARNRDLIGKYVKGTSFPEPGTLGKIAEALGKTVEWLAPNITAAAVDRENPELAMVAIRGHENQVHVTLNALVPLGIAVEISRLLERAKRAGAPLVPGVDIDIDE